MANLPTGDARTLREIRKNLGWTQTRMAEALGVRMNTVARWERGELATPRQAELAARYIHFKEKGEEHGQSE